MNTMLRSALIQDAPHVAEVFLSSRKEFLPFAPLAYTDAEVHQWIREALIPSGAVTVACAGATIVGIVAVAKKADSSWINHLYIAPGHTGKGIGACLLSYALSALPPPVRLYAFQANTGARSFYEKHGFKAIAFSDGSENEERCPDVLYELASPGGDITPPSSRRLQNVAHVKR